MTTATIFFFSSTGNSLYAAKRIAERLIEERDVSVRLLPISRALMAGKPDISDDIVGFVSPVYAYAVPRHVVRFLKSLTVKSTYTFGVLTYGAYRGAAPSHLRRVGARCGIRFDYIGAIKMVDDYLPLFSVEHQLEKDPGKQVEAHLDSIVSGIVQGKQALIRSDPISLIVTEILIALYPYRHMLRMCQRFSITEDCNHCGTCVRVCPSGNIRLTATGPQFGTECVSCLSCAHNCPRGAIHVAGERSCARYRNPHVSLKEIMDANDTTGNRRPEA